jgi:hypothetical protein
MGWFGEIKKKSNIFIWLEILGFYRQLLLKKLNPYWHFCVHFWQACKDICNRCREIRWVWATFSKVPANYPDPGNPGHYMLFVFKTPTTLHDGQQQPVDNFASRANLKWSFLKTVPFYLALVRWENSGLYSFDSEFTNNLNRGPVKIWAFFKTSSSPPRRNKCTFPNKSTENHQKKINILNIHQVRILTEIPFVSVEKTTDLWPKRCVRQFRLL